LGWIGIETTAFNNDYKQRSFMDTIIQEIANVGFTILVFVIGCVMINKFKGDMND
jgi:ABC-type antimicrobial peptide transport system permease subunit|tara:strand:- start:854 stop:1018 length:165 start_codon:yes stop_codon:yes gene_type:complete